MPSKQKKTAGPRGGLRASPRALRGWKWDGRKQLTSTPVRCRRDDWYSARAKLADGVRLDQAELPVRFLNGQEVIQQRVLRLHAPQDTQLAHELFGWIETPPEANYLQLCVPDRGLITQLAEITLQDVAERDPKCHPLANIPRWWTYQPPFPIRRVVLPANLSPVADLIDWCDVELLDTPRSLAQLRKKARGAACIIEPRWLDQLELDLSAIENLAQSAWLIVDLASMVWLLGRADIARTELVTHTSSTGIMSARIEYADVHTRGFALQDVVPFTTINHAGNFAIRVLRANRAWKRYADSVGFATLLSSETPWSEHHGDVLSAARPMSQGELMCTDLPWLLVGDQGPLLTPQLHTHLLRAHLGAPVHDHIQHWNRWEDGDVIIRDLSELARRRPRLHAVRWQSDSPDLAHLGLTLVPADGHADRHTMFATGRIDNLDLHPGLPPEPLAIFMKWLEREAREQTAWARRHLRGHVVTWQFDTADGLRYALHYDSAQPIAPLPPRITRLQLGEPRSSRNTKDTLVFPLDEGLFGDRSMDFQDKLTRQLCRVIERRAK